MENNIIRARKTGSILVTKGISGQTIRVWTKDGNLEAVETIMDGELVAVRATREGNTVVDSYGHTNAWKISKEVLQKKYEQDPNSNVLYHPKGGVQIFKKLNEDTTFNVPWGPNGSLIEQHIKAGGYANITNHDDVYGIAAEEFAETYEIISN